MKRRTARIRISLPIANVIFSLAVWCGTATAQEQPGSQAVATPARITQAIDDSVRVTLKGNVHPLARPEFDKGPAPDAQPMKRMMLVLQRSQEQETALQQLMEEQLTKSSPNYHRWLTPQQFGQQFGPADADIQQVTDWLTRQGFQGIRVGNGRTVIEFSGDVGQVRTAFHTEIHRFVINGESRSGNTSDPEIPAALSPVVANIVSLHNFPRQSYLRRAGMHTVTQDKRGVAQFTINGCGPAGQQCYAVGPADLKKIYNVPSTLNGTGVVIGIVGDSNLNPNDTVGFRTVFGITPATGPTIVVDGPDPGINGDESEGDLDVQTAGGVAPNATILFVTAEGTLTAFGTDLAAFHIIDDNLADVLSESFGTCELPVGSGAAQFYRAVWEEAAALGTTVTVSAGDNGSAGCDDFKTQSVAISGLAVNAIASTPFNVAVGGTDFDDVGRQTSFWSGSNAAGTQESALGYIPETTWNDSCAAGATSANLNTICANADNIVAGSGGPSAVNAKPFWQMALTPAGTFRDLPDVSLFASDGPQSLSFYPFCQADATGGQPSCTNTPPFVILGAGGTSASTPAFAGMMALIVQQEGGRQGNVGPILYKIAGLAGQSCNSTGQGLSGSTCSFNYITKGNNSVPCSGTSLNCSSTTAGTNGVLVDPANKTTPAWTTKAGYSLATGLGSVNLTNLAAQWKTVVMNFTPTATALTLNGGTSTVTVTHGTSVAAQVKVMPGSGITQPTGEVSLVGPAGMINTAIDSGSLPGTNPDTVTLNTTFLPGGSYNVMAQYAGDGTFAPSQSAPVPVQVSKENSGLQMEVILLDPNTGNILNPNATTYPYGPFATLRIDVKNSSGNPCLIFQATPVTTGCAPDATGTVTLMDNGNPLDGGTFKVNSAGHVEDLGVQLTGGAHAVTALYSGDLSYNPTPAASPVTLNVTVTPAATATSEGIAGPTGTVGIQFNLTADVTTTSFGVAPDCTKIVLMDGSTPIATGSNCQSHPGSPPITTAETIFPGLVRVSTSGVHTFTATFAGDQNYAASASAPQNLTFKFSNTPSIRANPPQVNRGQSTTLTALVDAEMPPPAPPPTGTVTFTGTVSGQIMSPVSCTATTDMVGNVACQASLSYTPTASETVAMSYSGDSNYLNSTISTMVTVLPTSFNVSSTTAAVTAGMTGSSTITVTPVSGFTGAVTINCPAAAMLPPGVTCPNAPVMVNVTSSAAVTAQLMVAVAAPSAQGATAMAMPETNAMWAVNASAQQPGSKGWLMTSAGTGLAAVLLVLLPKRRKRRVLLGMGLGLVCVASFTLGCGGGGGGGGGGPVATSTKITVTSPTKVAAGGTFTFMATVTGGTPTDQVQLLDGGMVIATAFVSGGTATLTTPAMNIVGTHSISAHYVGDPISTQPSTSGTLNVTVTGSTSIAITTSPTANPPAGPVNVNIN
jgi:hypothetical protein